MDSFESKWGHVPEGVNEKTKIGIICSVQLIVSIIILLALYPPFVCNTENEISASKISFVNVLLVSIIFTVVTTYVSYQNSHVNSHHHM